MDKGLIEQFEELGFEPPTDVLDKCIELCYTYNISDPVEFVEQWMAYSISHLNGAEPTIPYLMEMERKELAKELQALNNKKKQLNQITNLAHLSESSPLAIYGNASSLSSVNDHDDDIMDSYICKTPNTKAPVPRTPARHTELLFSATSYSPIAGTPRSHSEKSGKVVYTFGNANLVNGAKWASTKLQNIDIKQLITYEGEPLTSKGKYLFDNLIDKLTIAGDQIFFVGKSICEKYFGTNAEEYDLSNVDTPSQEAIKTIGRISCDFDGKLDPTSTILLGSDEIRCRTVRLNFSNTKSFGVFPGEIVMVTGMNPRGDTVMVNEIISDRVLLPPCQPKIDEQISFVIASGPFTNDDNILFEPMHDLILYCKDNKPDVIIMTGPFLDAQHTVISESIVLAEPFELLFERMIAGIVDVIGSDTTLCLVASHKDANTDPVYPTPPVTLKKTYPNVHMLPDPCMIELNGITVGITSTDIYEHILDFELSVNGGDKVKRVVNYLFNQGTFYPLCPPPFDEINYDSDLASKYAKIDVIPNVMILPSKQKCFIRDVNNCLVINPGRLSDEKAGGTFARFIIHPKNEEKDTNLSNYVACQIMKV